MISLRQRRGVVHRNGRCGEQGGHKQRGANSEHHALGRSVCAHVLFPFLVSRSFITCFIHRSPLLAIPLEEIGLCPTCAPASPTLGLPAQTDGLPAGHRVPPAFGIFWAAVAPLLLRA